MNQSQQKFLRKELMKVRRPDFYKLAEEKKPEPKMIAECRRKVARYDSDLRRVRERMEDRFSALRHDVEREILFGTEESVKKAFDALNAFKP